MSLICKKCSTENRESAIYCKKCGKKFSDAKIPPKEKIIDREKVMSDIDELTRSIECYKGEWNSGQKFNMHMIITGGTGSGKNLIVDYITDTLSEKNVIDKDKIKKYDATDFNSFIGELHQNFDKAKGGVIVFDNFHRLIPANRNMNSITEVDRIINEMNIFGNDPVVILLGDKKNFEDFIDNSASIKNRFEYFFRLRDYTASELYAICKTKLEGFELELDQKSAERLLSFFKYIVKNKDESFGNAYVAINSAGDIARSYYYRISQNNRDNKIVSVQDIKGDFPDPKTLNEIFAEIDELIGLEKIKAALRDIAQQVKQQKIRRMRGEKNVKVGFHMVLMGNPGTGKTMIARKLGEVLGAIDYLDRGHVVEVDQSGLVGQYIGETPNKVKKVCDKAMGGVLFIDEAYSLAPGIGSGSGSKYGKEAIDTILKRMEDDRDKFVVVAAGYRNEMQRFLNSNTGLKSRFDRFINIEDYTAAELTDIFKFFVRKNGYTVTSEAEDRAAEIIKDLYASRGKNFANAREVRRIFESAIIKLSKRLSANFSDGGVDYNLITLDDLPKSESRDIPIEEIFKELNDLVGLEELKNELKKLSTFVQAEEKRKKLLGEQSAFNLHFVFMGNPGTGKTTVARLLGKIFKALGILSKGHLIETDRSDFVASYIGQTSDKTNELIDTALGGVLFIDEAYSLVVENSQSDFGQQAIQTLLKRMEDEKGKFIVVAAGYPNEMQKFIDSNPGLDSRFKKQLRFDDYNDDELYQIFLRMVSAKKMKLSKDADKKVRNIFKKVYDERTENFGNGRTVRNVFDNALENQSFRIAPKLNDDTIDEDILLTIEAEDIIL